MKSPERISLTRTVKCTVSLGVFLVGALQEMVSRLSGKVQPGRCVVLYYHSVPREQRRNFARQMDTLLRYARPVSLEGNVILGAGVKAAAVTIDDGFENLLQNAIPELKERRIPATIFVISGAMGKMFGGGSEHPERVMSAEQLRTLPQDLITVGSHTVTHPFLPAINRETARREIHESRSQLSAVMQRDVRLFSFPFGGFTRQLLHLCREAGYRHVFTTLPYFALADLDEFVVGRVRVDPTDWRLEFFLKLAGAYHWLPWAFKLKRRLLRISRLLALKKERASQITIPRAVIQ
jgi:peptidoglycan/xylan/chitin deacetylase (PgdA/CDA1 family)